MQCLDCLVKNKHFQLNHTPKRSTLSDAYKRRDANVFGDIYSGLLKKYGHHISDSRIKDVINRQIEIVNSSTINLFKDILRINRKPVNDSSTKNTEKTVGLF